jgi:hypothetical protein
MTSGFAIVVEPAHAAELVPDWPIGAFLVAIRPKSGPDRWEACQEADIPGILGGIPAWPPTGALLVADVDAEDERDLIETVTNVPGLGYAAARRCVAEPDTRAPEPEIGDIDW